MRQEIERSIIIIGVGSIGGFVSAALSHMAKTYQTQFFLFDHDTVDAHNHVNQVYRREDIGALKVDTCKTLMNVASPLGSIQPHKEKVNESTLLIGPTIVAIDSCEERHVIFQAVRRSMRVPFLIDAHTGEGFATIVAFNPINPDHADRYESTLPTSKTAAPVPCASPDTIPLLYAVAGVVAELMNRYFHSTQDGIEWFSYVVTEINFTTAGGPSITTSIH